MQFNDYFPFLIIAKLCLRRNRLTDVENRLVVAGGRGTGEGTGSLAFLDANYTFRMDRQQGPNI